MDSYHHGALRAALIEATDALLGKKGPEAFSLREVARRAGVSAAAPAHHFGDASGLLTAVATLGFDGLADALRKGAARGGEDPRQRLREQGVGYVDFAMRYPGRFRLMFRGAMLREDADLDRAGSGAFAVLEEGVREAFALPAGKPMPATAWTALLTLWSVVHGYAHLAIAGRFDRLAGRAGRDPFVRGSLRPVLEAAIAGCVPPARSGKARRPARAAAKRLTQVK